MEFNILESIVLLLVVALVVSFTLVKLNIPTVIGFIISGILIGPHGAGIVSNTETINSIAEFGIILLMFTIGIEFAPARLFHIGREIIIGGGIQVFLTSALICIIAYFSGIGSMTGILIGFILALSSTAIVLKILNDRGETYTSYGKIVIGILLFQDLCVIPGMVILNLVDTQISTLAIKSFLSLLSLVLLFFLTYYTGRIILGGIAATMNRELFTIAVIVMGLGVPLLAFLSGSSYSLGAFIAGMGLSRCQFSHQVETEILPFRYVFNSIFFMSMGMFIDADFILTHLIVVVVITAGLIIVKIVTGLITARILSGSFRTIFLSAVALANTGEFSIILLGVSMEKGLINNDTYQILLGAASLSMIVAPLLIYFAGRVVFDIQKVLKDSETGIEFKKEEIPFNHVIVCGYGLNGQNLSKVLKAVGIKYVILDINPSTVRSVKLKGEPIFYGDVTRSDILIKAGIQTAKIIVFAISDPVATRRAVWISRHLNDKIYIFIRTRFVNEMEELYRIGANVVIPEEFETSIEIFAHVLKEYRIPDNVIEQQIKLIRMKDYEMLRLAVALNNRDSEIEKILLSTLTESIYIEGNYPIVKKSIEELNVRKETGASIIAVVRDGDAITNPPGELKLQKGDVIILIGSHVQLFRVRKLLTGS